MKNKSKNILETFLDLLSDIYSELLFKDISLYSGANS